MPGMMDTILNLGLNDESTTGLAARTNNPRFAYDSYRRLIQMYGEVVHGVQPERFESELTALKQRRGASSDTDLTSADLAELVESFLRIYRVEVGIQFPQDPRDQLARAIRAVFESWDAPRAKVYRRANESWRCER